MLKANFDQLYADGADSGTVMCIPLHPYAVVWPHRIEAFEEALEYITGHDDVWVTTGREIAEYYWDHGYGGGAASIAASGLVKPRTCRNNSAVDLISFPVPEFTSRI